MTNRLLISIVPPIAALLLASCSFAPNCGNSHPYKNYVAEAPLKAPPGVTLPQPDTAYRIPAAGTAAAPAAATSAQPCMVTPPSVLTPQDMARPGSPAPATQATPAPQAASPAPAPVTRRPPVAAPASME